MSLESTQFDIKGMHCASCVSKIEKALQQAPGVTQASVNLASNSASVAGDIDPAEITRCIEKLGYTVHVSGETLTEAGSHARLWLSVGLTLPVFVISMGHLHFAGSDIIQAVLGTLIVFGCGWPFFVSTLNAVSRKTADMDTLVTLGTTSAWGYSMVLLLTGQSGFYFESAAVIITFVLIGRHLEAQARIKTGDAIQALLSQKPVIAHRLGSNNTIEDISPDAIAIDDHLLIKPGESVPADGEVIEGHSSVDESMLTGESTPVKKTIGSVLKAGTVNTHGVLTFKATATGQNTVFAGIVRLTQNARNSKPKAQRLADTIAGRLVPVVILIAVITLGAWLLLTGNIEKALTSAVAVLVIACPCALGLATPVAIQAAIGAGARRGILLRNADVFERLTKIDILVLDKTGTLTLGQPSVTHFYKTSRYSDAEVLSLVASLESRSEHPMANALIAFASSKNIAGNLPVKNVDIQSGAGIYGEINEQHVLIGHENYLKQNNVDTHGLQTEAAQLKGEHNTLVWFAINKQLAGLVGVKDTLRPEAREVIARLKAQNIQTLMLTGDHADTARQIATEAGIDTVQAGASPEDKQKQIQTLQTQGKLVAMAGDGINDAAALTQADIGIAMGSGTQVAMESADITLAGGNFKNIPVALTLGKQTSQIIRQNLFWAFAYNFLALPLAAFGLLSPMIAGGAMALSSICVVLNALRLSRA